MILGYRILEFFRYRAADIFTRALLKRVNAHLDKICESYYRIAINYGYLYRTYIDAVLFAYSAKHFIKSRLGIVKAVYEESLRYSRRRCVIPRELRTDLNSGFTVYNNNGSVRSAYALAHFTLKIKKAGSVKYIYLCPIPKHRCGCG